MEQQFHPNFPSVPLVRHRTYGRTVRGTKLEEQSWGDMDKSILFLSGLSGADRQVVPFLLRWWDGITGTAPLSGIDREALRGRARLRLIANLNPDGAAAEDQNNKKPLETAENPSFDPGARNARGVCVNANFNAGWIDLRNRFSTRSDLGSFPESEAESAAFCALIRSDPPAAVIFFRQGENAFIYPPGSSAEGIRAARLIGGYAGVPVRESAPSPGSAAAWLIREGISVYGFRSLPADEDAPLPGTVFTLCCAALC